MLGRCPDCGAEYPDFHSPRGQLGTVCDECGWFSDPGEDHEREPAEPDEWDYDRAQDRYERSYLGWTEGTGYGDERWH